MARVRNNQGNRKKIAEVFIRPYIEQENTQEREAFLQAREKIKPLQDKTWQLAKQIVSRHYTPEDIKMAYHLQNKFDNVNTIAKDSCFHFGYMAKKEGETNEYEQEEYSGEHTEQDDKYITKHFDFRLDGNINGQENSRQNDFAYAMYRDELKGREGCNPDINIEQKDNQSNPHWTKIDDANSKYLGLGSTGRESDDHIKFSQEWNKDYVLDLIGREYCRDRSIACKENEYQILMTWQSAKGQLIMAHEKWIESILKQCKFVKDVIKGYKYLDEGIEFAKESGLELNDAEIIRTNSTGLVMYNPKNAAAMLKSMKNKTQTREDKILARMNYEKQAN